MKKDNSYSNYLFEQEKKDKKKKSQAMRNLKGSKSSRWLVKED